MHAYYIQIYINAYLENESIMLLYICCDLQIIFYYSDIAKDFLLLDIIDCQL